MSVRVFVDTNVLVYARDASEQARQPRARAWLETLWRERAGRLSVQVLQEYYLTVTSKLKPGLPVDRARDEIRHFTAWKPLPVDQQLLEQSWLIESRYELSFWDAAIVAAASALKCGLLLTEDLQDGQDFGGVEVINPFTHEISDFFQIRR